jgi:hypothetical protein
MWRRVIQSKADGGSGRACALWSDIPKSCPLCTAWPQVVHAVHCMAVHCMACQRSRKKKDRISGCAKDVAMSATNFAAPYRVTRRDVLSTVLLHSHAKARCEGVARSLATQDMMQTTRQASHPLVLNAMATTHADLPYLTTALVHLITALLQTAKTDIPESRAGQAR